MTSVRCWIVLLVAAYALPTAASVTYTYRGPDFSEFWGSPPYTTSSHISGSFTLAAPLPANLPQTEISSRLMGYNFTDGFQSRTPSNTEVCASHLYGFRVSTDANGAIATWAITLCSPVSAAADPLTAIFTIHGFASATDEDVGISEATCDFLELGSCTSITSSNWGRRLNGNDETLWSVQGAAVEYHHRTFDHYFITSLPNEIAALDAGTFADWSRTGHSFLAYPLDTPGTANVCRFWSGQAFAPRSSHFYTPYADECANVKQDPVWQFEGHAFALRLPEAGLGYVTCPSGTRPLYRAYNRGVSGAPNHRYTTDGAVLGEMVAQGWQVEGDLWTRIFACVPAQE